MARLAQRYCFNWHRILTEDKYHIEYSITDICNRNCASCSHLAPLAKRPNFVGIEEFSRVVGIMQKVVPDVHTFWLTGGEPTLHPEYLKLLQMLREVYPDCYVGIYSNGITLPAYVENETFWEFVRESGIVWAITNYGMDKGYFEELFAERGCLNNLAVIQSGRTFANLTNYARNQPVTREKYEKCGWERSKINIRNGRIYNCPSSEFADLFNGYFNENLPVTAGDYLQIDENLTHEQIEAFRGPMPFCGQCDLSKRYKKVFANAPSGRSKNEWAEI